ncbi:D-sedoheptulose 7-phosphate isomerase [Nostoc sp. MS1]|uniref:D-sedoheptulose 7-phosphate isomerase n=1 Tax=Nostoc sp. MS1 TaxID=2764711 RepID=UPI001CC46784|nr:D-sedoheptulose 7-phosphate isomerase [Nostoc sp. MS1]BCL35883.1 phosphoheptose isomerase [Nostoc sp. MS1]
MDYWVQDKLKSLEAAFTPEYCQAIDKVVGLIVESFQKGNTLFICGNGGSASDAQHIAAEFIGRFLVNRKGLPAIALSTNPATLTAWTNDHEFETIFSRQVESLGKPGDIVWGISTSGKSQNVIRALKASQQMGIITIGMAGNEGGMLQGVADYPLFVAEQHTPLVQEIHVITYHRICELVEFQLFTK